MTDCGACVWWLPLWQQLDVPFDLAEREPLFAIHSTFNSLHGSVFSSMALFT